MRKTKHPGEYLHQFIIRKNIDVENWAAKMGIKTTMLQDFINCKFSVDSDFAKRLYSVTGVSVAFWLNLQSHHDNTLKN